MVGAAQGVVLYPEMFLCAIEGNRITHCFYMMFELINVQFACAAPTTRAEDVSRMYKKKGRDRGFFRRGVRVQGLSWVKREEEEEEEEEGESMGGLLWGKGRGSRWWCRGW